MHKRTRREDLAPARPPIAAMEVWGRLRPWIDRQVGSQNQSRLPFKRDMPPALKREALELQVPCVHCRQPHHPVRCSAGSETPALFVTGMRDSGHKRCSYGNDASAAILWLQIDLKKVPPPARPQGTLW